MNYDNRTNVDINSNNKICPSCKKPNRDGATFCTSCGYRYHSLENEGKEKKKLFIGDVYIDLVQMISSGQEINVSKVLEEVLNTIDGLQSVAIDSHRITFNSQEIRQLVETVFKNIGLIEKKPITPGEKIVDYIRRTKNKGRKKLSADELRSQALDACAILPKMLGVRSDVFDITYLLLLKKNSQLIDADDKKITDPIKNGELEKLKETPTILPDGSFSIKSKDHENHDVHGKTTFLGPDGEQVDRYLLGDGSGGSGANDQQTQQKMEYMKGVALRSVSKKIGESLQEADKQGRDFQNRLNPAYGVMAGVDIVRKDGVIQKVEVASIGDSVIMGWKRDMFPHRRSSGHRVLGGPSNFMRYTSSHSLAMSMQQSGEQNVLTNRLDVMPEANQIYRAMGESDNTKSVLPEEFTIVEGEDFPEILILASDGVQPNNLLVPEEQFNKHVNTLLNDYVTGNSSYSLAEIAKRICVYSRTENNDADDITITLIDLRPKK